MVEPFSDSDDETTKLYLFGGRLVSNRRMVNHLYQLELETMKWTRLSPSGGENASAPSNDPIAQPQPRYFHSADLWQDKIIIFGGMGYSKKSSTQDLSTPKSSAEGKSDDLCVLDEVIAFDLKTHTWDLSFASNPETNAPLPSSSDANSDSYRLASSDARPAPRYAHLSSISGDSLVIVGGQNMTNQYVETINVLSLSKRTWIGSQRFMRQCGSYRSLAVSAKYNLTDGEKAKCYPRGRDPLTGLEDDSVQGSGHGAEARSAKSAESPFVKVEQNPLSMSVVPTSDRPAPVFVYSNYNFTDVRRELELLHVRADALNQASSKVTPRGRSASNASQDSALDVEMPLSPSADPNHHEQSGPFVDIEDRSSLMGGSTLPPGLRFPTGAVLGSYLIISGTYLANATQTFSIWALHLPTLTWSRLEAGSALSSGSWNRAILWPGKNRMIIVGNKERDLVSDYNHRQTNWDHIVVLELEAWGIYQPPTPGLSDAAAQLGLDKLATSAASAVGSPTKLKSSALDATKLSIELNKSAKISEGAEGDSANAEFERRPLPLLPESFGGNGDFEIVCSDGVRIGCDRAILESRWPWFKDKMDEYRKKSRRTARAVSGTLEHDTKTLSLIPEELADILDEEPLEELADVDTVEGAHARLEGRTSGTVRVNDPRFQPRSFQLSEPAPIVLAFLQFLYSQRICTALQRHPAVVCALLVLAKTYSLDLLLAWAKHAAHIALADDLNPKSSSSSEARGNSSLAPAGSTTENGGMGTDIFRPTDSLGLHPEERHRLAVCLYEASSLCGCEGLQIRALRVVMSVARWLQKHGSSGAAPGSGADRSGATGGSNGRPPANSGSGPSQGDAGSGSGTSSGNSMGTATIGQRGLFGVRAQSTNLADGVAYENGVARPARKDSMMSSQGPLSPAISLAPSSAASMHFQSEEGSPRASDAESTQRFHQNAALSRMKAERLLGVTESDLRVPSEFGAHRTDHFGQNQGDASSIGSTPSSLSARLTGGKKRFSLFGRSPNGNEPASFDSPSVDKDFMTVDSAYATDVPTQKSFDSGLLSIFGRRTSLDRSHSPGLASVTSFATDASSRAPDGYSVNETLATTTGSIGSNRYGSDKSPLSSGMDPNFASSLGYFTESTSTSASASQQNLFALSPPSAELARPFSVSHMIDDTETTARANGETIEVVDQTEHQDKPLSKAEKKRLEKEEKARKKAEKAEFKRLAADAVFGPKGSAGPLSPSFSTGSFSDASGSASTLQIRRGSEPDTMGSGKSRASSVRSGTSTASPGASIMTNKSPRTPISPVTQPGEWSVSSMSTPMWFAGGPAPTPKMNMRTSKSNRSVSSLSGKSSHKKKVLT